MKSAIVESELGNVEAERRLLAQGLKQFPSFFKLWLILGQPEERIPLWLLLANLDVKVNGLNIAQVILSMVREKNPQGAEIWSRRRILTEMRLLDDGLKRFPSFVKLRLMLGQLEERFGHLDQAYGYGLKHCLNCVPLWLSLANLDEKVNGQNKSLVFLSMVREKNPQGDEIWSRRKILTERRLLDDGLKPFPSFFMLWLMLGQLEERFGHLEQSYGCGLNHCVNCIPLWLSLADLEEKVNELKKARVILTLAKEKNFQAAELLLAEPRHENKREADHLKSKALQECLNDGILWDADIHMLQYENKDPERARMILAKERDIVGTERRLLKGDHLPSALLGNYKDYSISAIYQSSVGKEKDVSSSEDEEGGSSSKVKEDVSSSEVEEDGSSSKVEEEDVPSSEDEEGGSSEVEESDDTDSSEYSFQKFIIYPTSSTALRMLSKDYLKLLEKNLTNHIEEEEAKKCLCKISFMFVLETNPIPLSHFLSYSNGCVFLFWLTLGRGDKYLVKEENRLRLFRALGRIRDQKNHLLCWAYVDCDLISSSRFLHGLDNEFVPLSPMFLCRNVCPDRYRDNCQTKTHGEHCCSGNSLVNGLMYAKLHGVPREKPEDKEFDCQLSEQFRVGDEELYKITEVFEYYTLESALERLNTGYPIGAALMLFDGWNKNRGKVENYDEMYIYSGPEPGAKYYCDHAVILMDFRVLRGIKVGICKMSNGENVANGGYIAVNLEIMVTAVGMDDPPNWYYNKPQYLLRNFYSIDMEMSGEPLITVDPDRAKDNMRFKVDNDNADTLIAPEYQTSGLEHKKYDATDEEALRDDDAKSEEPKVDKVVTEFERNR